MIITNVVSFLSVVLILGESFSGVKKLSFMAWVHYNTYYN